MKNAIELIFREKAELTKSFIEVYEEDLKEDGSKIIVEILRSNEKKAKAIYHEVLGDQYIKYIEFRRRKRTKTERALLLYKWLIPFTLIYTITLITLIITGSISDHVLYFMLYLLNAVGVVFSLNILTKAIKFKHKKAMPLFLLFINGSMMIMNLIALYS